MKKRILSFLLLVPFFVNAQNNIPTGSWRTHYAFNNVISITQSNSEIYAASSTGFFSISKNDGSITSYTKLNGLSETGITRIGYNPTTNTLLIAYKSGQIDLVQNNKFTSLSDIRLANIIYSKATNHIYTNGVYFYLSTDFGIVVIDTETISIKESYLNLGSTGNNLKIYSSTIYSDSLFLATQDGIIAGSLNDNLKDYSIWKRFDVNTGLNQTPIKVLSLYQNKPITGVDNSGIYIYSNGSWSNTGNLTNDAFKAIEPMATDALICTTNGVFRLSGNGVTGIQSTYINNPSIAINDNATIWIADNKNGVVKIEGTSNESLYPNGPYFNTITKLKSIEGKVFAFSAYKNTLGQPIRNAEGFSLFDNGQWSNYNSTGNPKTITIPEFLDISSVSSYNNGYLFSSNGFGLLTWQNNEFSIIDESNSPLINSSPPDRYVIVNDIASSKQGTWVLNNNNISSSLLLLGADQSWSSYITSGIVANANQIETTPWGESWMAINTSGGGIYVYNTNGDDQLLTSSGNGTIPSNTINDIMLDRDDKMWIATNKGVVYFPYPYNILSDPNQEVVIPIIDFRPLFYQENVNTLAVDGGNRIWMGTNNGAWLFSNDGTELVEHFTSENSPLLSNIVTDIAINDLTGEVFLNTDAGLISYRGTGTLTGTYKTPKIFPNPVPPGFSGIVTIEGVPENSEIKITDASGRLVANIYANGNTAVWNMLNNHLSEVGTGVYFVFISLEDGTEHQFGKIAIVK